VRHEAGSNLTLTAADARALAREVPSIVVAAPFVAERNTVVFGNRNWSTLLAGVTPAYFEARGWKLAEGQWFTEGHLAAAAKVALVGRTVVRELFGGGDVIRGGCMDRNSRTLVVRQPHDPTLG